MLGGSRRLVIGSHSEGKGDRSAVLSLKALRELEALTISFAESSISPLASGYLNRSRRAALSEGSEQFVY